MALRRILKGVLILAAIIAAILSFLTPMVLGIWGSAGTIAIIVILVLAAIIERTLPREIEEEEKKDRRLRYAKKIAGEFSNFLGKISTARVGLEFVSKNELLGVSEPLEKSVPELLMSRGIQELDQDRTDCLTVLWLAFHWTEVKASVGGPELEVFHILDGTFRSSFPTLKYTPKTKLLMLAYEKIRHTWTNVPRQELSVLFEGELSVEKYRDLMYDFLARIGQQHLFETLRANRAEALRATLISLVAEGRLASHGLRKDLIDQIQRELRKHGMGGNVFMVFKNKFYELEDYLGSLPHLKGKAAVSPRGLGFPENARIFMTVVKTPRPYRDAEHFVETEIRPRIRSRDGFLAVFPADLLGAVIFPTQKDFVGKGIVATNFELVNYLLTGFKEVDLDIWMLLAKHEVPVEEVLSIIPLTVLAVDLPQEAVIELWQRYDAMKSRFRIRTLPDWAGVSPDSLADFLVETLPSFRTISREDLKDKCRQIVEEARRIRTALIPTQLELST